MGQNSTITAPVKPSMGPRRESCRYVQTEHGFQALETWNYPEHIH